MPRLRATNVAHTAVTDHRIPRNAVRIRNAMPAADSITDLHAWREPADDFSRQRGLGLAYYENGATHHINADLLKAYELLKPLALANIGDADVQGAVLGILALDKHQAAVAIPHLEDAVKASPKNAHLRLLLGSELAQHGERERAIEELDASILLDPSKPEAYRKLAEVYGNSSMHQKTLERYLQFMPQSIRVRESLRSGLQ
jgi:predicted Zn-dependent protease